MFLQLLSGSLDMLAGQWEVLVRAFARLALDIGTARTTDRKYKDQEAQQDFRLAEVKSDLPRESLFGICRAEIDALKAFKARSAVVRVDPVVRFRHGIRRVRISFALLAHPPGNPNVQDEINALHAEAVEEWKKLTVPPAPERKPDPAFDEKQYAPQPIGGGNSIRSMFEELFGTAKKEPGVEILDGFKAAVDNCRERIDDLERFINLQLEQLIVVDSEPGLRANVAGIRAGVEDLGSFPILTSELGGFGSSGGSVGYAQPAGGANNGYRQLIDNTLRQVIGRVPRLADTGSFVSALKQSFEITEVDGGTQYKWLPRTYAGQAELGGHITGAQASLYAQASAGLDRSLDLLNALEALNPAADEEEMDAALVIVTTELTQVVSELKIEGGPRVPRVDQLFEQLVGKDPDPGRADGRGVGGDLGHLRDTYGLVDANINTLDEEGIVSNFIAVQDYVLATRTSWIQFRKLWQGQDLGTRFVTLQRALSVVNDSVQEVYAAMDSVFVGAAERQVAKFPMRKRGGTMAVEELLSWIVGFATDEAPKLIRDGGRRGVTAIQPTAVLLEELVSDLLAANTIPAGMRHARVRRPLEEVRGFLDDIQTLADEVRRPLRSTP